MNNPIETHSSTWQAVEAWARSQLSRDCQRLESPAMDAATTAVLRGRIAALRELLALSNPPPPPVVSTPDSYGI